MFCPACVCSDTAMRARRVTVEAEAPESGVEERAPRTQPRPELGYEP